MQLYNIQVLLYDSPLVEHLLTISGSITYELAVQLLFLCTGGFALASTSALLKVFFPSWWSVYLPLQAGFQP